MLLPAVKESPWTGGYVVADRFVLEEETGAGGAGTVHRARDMQSGEPVAIKLVRDVTGLDLARFAREAQALARFRHSHVVRYVAHGLDQNGLPYLAMEWLEGEDLRRRLSRAPLTLQETVTLGRCAAEALVAVHAGGFLHRDIKPGNLFLVDRQVDRVKILDFGVVRGDIEALSLTHTGVIVGTPGYMAPEQARGQRDIDPRADLFSLGCVLYRCLSGYAPFDGSNVLAVMSKVILEEPPKLRTLRPDIPPALADLVHRMLDKDPDLRPRSAADVVAALSVLVLDGVDAPAPEGPPSRGLGLTGRELRITVVLLVGPAALPKPELLDLFVAEQGGQMERLAGGSRVITLTRASVATDQVIWAARCALAIKTMLPSVPMALAMGHRDVSEITLMGGAIDRVTTLFGAGASAASAAALAGDPLPSWIAIDAEAAALLNGRFEVRRDSAVLQLLGERDSSVGARRLLGRATPMVGRDWELSTILSLFEGCLEGPSASAVLVTGSAGMGKSRLAAELATRLKGHRADAEIWLSRGSSAYAGSPLHMLRNLLRSALGCEGLAPEAQRQRIVDRVAGKVAPDITLRVAEYLGEIMGIPFPDAERPGLRAARSDPMILGEQMQWAWEMFAAAEGAARPLVLIVDDLQWGDLPSIRLLQAALERLDRSAFLVVMLARPEAQALFPELWRQSTFQEIRLKPLTPKASERLVQSALGSAATPEERARLVARAEGNAFFLEELIRSFAERSNDEDSLPDTVIATVQARFGGLDGETRRLLRAASVFGDVFWANGVAVLMGDVRLPSIGPWIDALVSREILVRRPASRFPGEPELAFRHALLREGAYSMLTEEDRALGHRLAGAWLERAGERDPLVLARHFEMGGEPDRAAPFYADAAERAMRGLDLEGAITLAERALSRQCPDELRVGVLMTLSQARLWRLQLPEAAAAAEELVRAAPYGSPSWVIGRTIELSTALSLGRPAAIQDALVALMAFEPTGESASHHALALAAGVYVLMHQGQFGAVDALMAMVSKLAERTHDRDLIARAWTSLAHAHVAAFKHGDAWTAAGHAQRGVADFDEAADRKNAAMARVFLAGHLLRAGALGAAGQALDRAMAHDPGAMVVEMCSFGHAEWALERSDFEVVERIAAERIEKTLETSPMGPLRMAEGLFLRSEIARRKGDFAAAEQTLSQAIGVLRFMPLTGQVAAAKLARSLLALGRAEEALATAREAMSAVDAQGGEGYRGLLVRLAFAEALDACGERDASRAALAGAHERLMVLASRIQDAEARTAFLEHVEENAAIAQLARAWLESASEGSGA